MSLAYLLSSFRRKLFIRPGIARPRPVKPMRARLAVEILEYRIVPTAGLSGPDDDCGCGTHENDRAELCAEGHGDCDCEDDPLAAAWRVDETREALLQSYRPVPMAPPAAALSSVTSARLTVRVFDVDFHATSGDPERDEIYLNGTRLTTPGAYLTGANDQWSTVSFDVNPAILRQGANEVRIIIDVLGAGWCLSCDWGQLEITRSDGTTQTFRTDEGPDLDLYQPCSGGDKLIQFDINVYDLRVKEVFAYDDVTIAGHDDKVYDAASPGNTKPIADHVLNSFGITWGGSFTLDVHFDAGTAAFPGETFQVDYAWEIEEGQQIHVGEGTFPLSASDLDEKLTIRMPGSVGQYEVKLHFRIKDARGNVVGMREVPLRLLATYKKPTFWIADPKLEWLEKGTLWASGAVTDTQVAERIMNGIYTQSGWQYRDVLGRNWEQLSGLGGTSSSGNCFTFAYAWEGLCDSLGVNAEIADTVDGTGPLRQFVAKPATSLGSPGIVGNAHPPGGAVDRWVFIAHQVGYYNGTYYDPTFGKKWTGPLDDFVLAYATTGKESMAGISTIEAGGQTYSETGSLPIHGWGDWVYAPTPPPGPTPPPSPAPAPPVAAAAVGSVTLTGVRGIDADSGGVFDSLAFDINFDATSTGNYTLKGSLLKGTSFITSRESNSRMTDALVPVSVTSTGVKSATITFSGEDIFKAGLDGPFTGQLTLIDPNAASTTVSFATAALSHTQFGEVDASIGTVTGAGRDSNGNGKFEDLLVSVPVNVRAATDLFVEANLFTATGTYIATKAVKFSRPAGSHTLTLAIDGAAIRASGANGPYTVKVAVFDKGREQVGFGTAQTAAYSHLDFESPGQISGNFRDSGLDTNGNSFFDRLVVEMDATVRTAGSYHVEASLYDGAGILIQTLINTMSLQAGVNSLRFEFDGRTIHDHGIAGPYAIRYVALGSEDILDAVQDAFSTTAYTVAQFEPASTAAVQFTGTFSDQAFDDNGDAILDRLVIRTEVFATQTGLFDFNGRLLDVNGHEIGFAGSSANLTAGQTRTLELSFDGDAIFNNGGDGPFTLRDLSVYLVSDPSKGAFLSSAYTTPFYAARDFGLPPPSILTFAEDTPNLLGVTVAGMLTNATDADAGALKGAAVVSLGGTGTWQYSINNGSTWLNFGTPSATAARLLRSTDKVRFLPAKNFNGIATITYHAWDQTTGSAGGLADLTTQGTGGSTSYSANQKVATVTVTAVNDAPVLAGGGKLTPVLPAAAAAAGDTVASILGTTVSDVDAGALRGLAVIRTTGTASQGTWQYSLNGGATWTDMGTVSGNAALLLRATDRVRFEAKAGFRGKVVMTYRAWDQTAGTAGSKVAIGAKGGTTPYSAATQTAPLLVNPANHAPVLAGGGKLTSVLPGTTAPAGDTVASILGTTVSDVDAGALRGLAVIGATGTASEGTWQYSLNNGTTWTDMGAVSATNALLLRDTDKVRFVPEPGFLGKVTLTYRAWDQTAGTAGSKVAIGAKGGTTPYSVAMQTATLPVNTAPTLTPTNPLAATFNEDTPNLSGFTIAGFLGNSVNDDAGALQGIAVVGLGGTGTWQYSLNNGGTWVGFGTPSGTAARLLRSTDKIRFLPATDFNGNATVTYHAWDQTLGSAGGTADLTPPGRGGATSFSQAQDVARVAVTPVNDAPVLAGGGKLTPVLSQVSTFSSTDTPLNIPDAPAAGIVSTLNVPTAGIITDIDVTLNIHHTFDADLDIFLTGPDNTRIELFGDVGGGGDNFSGTILDDEAGVAIGGLGSSSAPFTGRFRAEQLLSAFDGKSMLGAWKLEITDDLEIDTGTLDSWSLTITFASAGSLGDTVGSILGSTVSDVDAGALRGLAVIGATGTASQGTWHYSLNNGTTWTDMGAVSATNALLLRDTDRVRFVPKPGFLGKVTLTYRAWDRTAGTAGSKVAIGAKGGTTPYSAATQTATLLVNPVNHAPVLAGGGKLTSVLPGTTAPAGDTVASILGTTVSDVDAGALRGLAVIGATGTASEGTWQYSLNNGTTWIDMGAVSATNALLLRDTDKVRFVPKPGFLGKVTLTYRAWDQRTGTAGTKTALTSTGGASAFSAATQAAVLLVNTAPLFA